MCARAAAVDWSRSAQIVGSLDQPCFTALSRPSVVCSRRRRRRGRRAARGRLGPHQSTSFDYIVDQALFELRIGEKIIGEDQPSRTN